MSWVPKPNKNTNTVNRIPDCWVECDGRSIPSGIWAGQNTPDLNNAQRFLRGGTQAHVLETQDDAIQEHKHYVNDPGHTHSHTDRYTGPDWDWGSDGAEGRDKHRESWNAYHSDTTESARTGISVTSVKNARTSSETRPKNMKVTFIMKVC